MRDGRAVSSRNVGVETGRARRLPHHRARARIERDDRTRAVLIVRHDHVSFVNHRRGPVAVLRDKRPQIATPELFAGVIVGAHPKVIVGNKTGDDTLGVDDGRGIGVAGVFIAQARHRQRITLLPQFLPIRFAHANDRALVSVIEGGQQEQPVTPSDRLRVARAGDRHAPSKTVFRPGNRNALGGADTRAVRAAEAGPLLGIRLDDEARGRDQNQKGGVGREFHGVMEEGIVMGEGT